jgi:hypothetical protein
MLPAAVVRPAIIAVAATPRAPSPPRALPSRWTTRCSWRDWVAVVSETNARSIVADDSRYQFEPASFGCLCTRGRDPGLRRDGNSAGNRRWDIAATGWGLRGPVERQARVVCNLLSSEPRDCGPRSLTRQVAPKRSFTGATFRSRGCRMDAAPGAPPAHRSRTSCCSSPPRW